MRARLRCRGIAVALLVWTEAGRTAVEASSPSPLPNDDPPGCRCPASTTCGSSFNSYSEVLACSLVKRSDPPYVFEGVVNSTAPVCDALESDADFRELHGFGGAGAEPGFLPIEVVTGTCADARARQDSCPTNFRDDGPTGGERAAAANESATAAEDDSAADGGLGGSLVGRFMGIPDRCQYNSVKQPVGGLGDRSFRRSLRVITTCRSEFDEAVSKGYADDELLIYMEMEIDYGSGAEEESRLEMQLQPEPAPSSPCGRSRMADRRPVLTSDDWIEPRGGRRHMCHDFVRGGRPYSMLVVSLGVEPCGGAATRAPTGAPTPLLVEASSVGSLVPTTRNGAVGLALAVAISLCIL